MICILALEKRCAVTSFPHSGMYYAVCSFRHQLIQIHVPVRQSVRPRGVEVRRLDVMWGLCRKECSQLQCMLQSPRRFVSLRAGRQSESLQGCVLGAASCPAAANASVQVEVPSDVDGPSPSRFGPFARVAAQALSELLEPGLHTCNNCQHLNTYGSLLRSENDYSMLLPITSYMPLRLAILSISPCYNHCILQVSLHPV